MDTKSPDGGIAVALGLVMGATALALGWAGRPRLGAERAPTDLPALASPAAPAIRRQDAVLAARRLNRAAGILAGSVLFDSAVEHYRGAFHNKAMFTPLVTSGLSLAVSAHGTQDQRQAAHRTRDAVYATTALVGVLGTGFHLWNIGKKPGGFGWQNLFYSAPAGAPAALMLSGLLGFLSERVRNTEPGDPPSILGIPAGRAIGGVTGAGILGTVAETALLHFRGAFHNPAMALPVTLPPIAASLVGYAALAAARRPRPITRWWLRATAILGVAGSAFHSVGVARSMGGWRNWRQNLQDGPPIPAPPAFTGLALAGLAALGLLEDRPDD